MLATVRTFGIALAISLAALPPLAGAQSVTPPQMRMNQTAVGVTSTAPVNGVEPVQFSGQALIKSRLAPDVEFGKPTFVMLVDLTGITGVGAQTGTKYILSSQEYIVRPHAASQSVELTFPMATGPDATIDRVRTGSARLVMNVDVGSGAITSTAAALSAR